MNVLSFLFLKPYYRPKKMMLTTNRLKIKGAKAY